MKVLCAYCRQVIEESPANPEGTVSHGMCSDCADYFRPQWEGLSLGGYLDRFQFPVLLVDGDCRILSANREMAAMLGRDESERHGLPAGEALECVYARLDGGCGQTVHCRTCAIRNSVTETAQTGESIYMQECYVNLDAGKKRCHISTVKLGRSVMVVFEDGA